MRLDHSTEALELLRTLRNEGRVKDCDWAVVDELVSAGVAEHQDGWLVLSVDGESVSTSVIRRFL
jgi:hypothetical protein